MKNTLLLSTNGQRGFIGALIAVLLAAAGLLGIFYSAITTSSEYNHMHRLAQEVAADPNSHSDEEILNGGEALYNMMSKTAQSAGGVPGGLGAKQLMVAEEALRKIRQQQYIIVITLSPPDPGPYEGITVTLEIQNSLTGTPVTYSLSGSDGYHKGATLTTNAQGTVSFSVPGGASGVTDVFTVTVGPITQTFSYTF
jgi:hypothetical protein